MEQHKARRNQLQNEEMFEPIEIDFGYEDAVAFDSDKGIFEGLPGSITSKLSVKSLESFKIVSMCVELEGNFIVRGSLCMRPSQFSGLKS